MPKKIEAAQLLWFEVRRFGAPPMADMSILVTLITLIIKENVRVRAGAEFPPLLLSLAAHFLLYKSFL